MRDRLGCPFEKIRSFVVLQTGGGPRAIRDPFLGRKTPKNAMESALLRFRRFPSLCGGST
jgi:hypothetical protein